MAWHGVTTLGRIEMAKTIAAAVFVLIAAMSYVNAQTIQTTVRTTMRTTTVSADTEGDANCLVTGRVVGLNPYDDTFLSVRRRPYGPSGPDDEKDELFTNNQVCVMLTAGRWLFVQYERAGRMYSGWVFDRYIRED